MLNTKKDQYLTSDGILGTLAPRFPFSQEVTPESEGIGWQETDTYTFFFCPFFLKFLGFFPAVILRWLFLFLGIRSNARKGFLINNKLN